MELTEKTVYKTCCTRHFINKKSASRLWFSTFNCSLQKGSPYLDMVNAKLHLLHENGLLDMWSNEMVAEAGKCDTVRKAVASHGKSNNVKLTMEYVDSLFLIFWGFSLAILGLIIEAIWAKCFI